MSNHPNRGKGNRSLGATPTPAEILAAREAAGLTQTAAGELIYSGLRGWQNYESGERRMHPQLFEAFLIKTGQAPRALYAAIEAARK